MPAIITDQYRILNAETFVDSFVGIGTTGNNNYYSFLGHPNPKNIDVGMAERLLEKHRDIVTLSFNKQTHFTIENLLEEVKELEND